jgi:hypothetical protein
MIRPILPVLIQASALGGDVDEVISGAELADTVGDDDTGGRSFGDSDLEPPASRPALPGRASSAEGCAVPRAGAVHTRVVHRRDFETSPARLEQSQGADALLDPRRNGPEEVVVP